MCDRPPFSFFTNISPREQFNARFFPGFQGPNQKQLANQPSLNGATTPAATTSNLSGNADQFTAIDRERCPTPAEREIMDSFKPRELTEAVMSRFYKKHNPEKLHAVDDLLENLFLCTSGHSGRFQGSSPRCARQLEGSAGAIGAGSRR